MILNNRYRYGITERKKAELDALTEAVQNAQYEVDQLQAVVTSMTEKDNEFAEFLSAAERTTETTLANKNLVEQVVNDADNLNQDVNLAQKQTVKANGEIQDVAKRATTVVDQLIFASEVIGKLAEMINSKKALNPLISGDLVALVTKAGTDANNAVTLQLTGMKACYASMDTVKEANAITKLEANQAGQLCEALTGGDDLKKQEASIQGILQTAYMKAVQDNQTALEAKAETTKQLNKAKKDLDEATIKLNSLKAGFSAANAAALAA